MKKGDSGRTRKIVIILIIIAIVFSAIAIMLNSSLFSSFKKSATNPGSTSVVDSSPLTNAGGNVAITVKRGSD